MPTGSELVQCRGQSAQHRAWFSGRSTVVRWELPSQLGGDAAAGEWMGTQFLAIAQKRRAHNAAVWAEGVCGGVGLGEREGSRIKRSYIPGSIVAGRGRAINQSAATSAWG